MSVYSGKTTLTSILKNYCPKGRDKTKNAIVNKVRFEMPRQKGVSYLVEAACNQNDLCPMEEFVLFLRQEELTDDEFTKIIGEAHDAIQKLDTKFDVFVESLLALPWTKRTPEATKAYTEFCIDLIVAHNKYAYYGISKFVTLWIPADTDEELWPKGTPLLAVENELNAVHKLIDRILTVIPMTFDILLHTIETNFPYFKKPTHVTAGYMHNLIQLMTYKPIFTEFVMQLILQKLIILDVNAPRSEIEDAEDDDDDEDEDDEEQQMGEEQIFQMDDCNKYASDGKETLPMNHAIANTLDVCMEKMYALFDTKNPNGLTNLTELDPVKRRTKSTQFLKILLDAFDNIVLPTHNTHHVQFLIFYYCSFQSTLAETFLSTLWKKIHNPNVSSVIRTAAVGYMASFLARSKILTLTILNYYLKELCNWAHQYIERSDQYRSNGSLKANLVFFSVCQAIFYVIAFRSRDLTGSKKGLLFLQSLQLSALVACNFNPLRVCLPPVATAFAGVTRAYQLAYCHAILERNARRKLATVYANDTSSTPEEVLDTFFPFDPYLLKLSGYRIHPYYLQYKASEAEEELIITTHKPNDNLLHRKRGDSEMIDEIDDFIIADKRQKIVDLAKSQEREAQFTYGLSPGFHI